MKHNDHVNLIRNAVPGPGVWADLGSGAGAFTLALAELLGPNGVIYSVDRDRSVLHEQERTLHARYPAVEAHFVPGDFTRPLDLPGLDGILMANSLHFIPAGKKADVLRQLKSYLKPDGRFVVVEYNVDSGNLWVPHPFSYASWEKLAAQAGFERTCLLATHPSSFLREFYSALSF